MRAFATSMEIPAGTLAILGAAAMLAGCASLTRTPLPPELAEQASIPGMPDVRAWAGRRSPAMERDLEESFAQELAAEFSAGPDGLVSYPHLALSGGGAYGAFGAGFLNGWSSTGRRPVFKIVTGVSTGALMAPFAFLGQTYDGALRDFYTTTRSRDIFARGSLLGRLLAGESIADTAPLAALIARDVDDLFLSGVAAAHRQGRRLYIGTANLDAQQFVVWNMGLIAASSHPAAPDLFRKVMLASASIPVAFPPVFFDVEAGGRRYDEMHVDGGVGTRVFYNAGLFSAATLRARAGREGGREDVFVIHNGRLVAEPSPTPRTLRGIAVRSLEASGRAAVVGDLVRIYTAAAREQATFQWVDIPDGVDLTASEAFDPVQMTRLFEAGFEYARRGPVWYTQPPGFRPTDTAP